MYLFGYACRSHALHVLHPPHGPTYPTMNQVASQSFWCICGDAQFIPWLSLTSRDTMPENPKAQVVDKVCYFQPTSRLWHCANTRKIPKRFKSLKFGIQCAISSLKLFATTTLTWDRSNQDIANQAVLEVSDRMLYDVENLRRPVQHGPLDQRLVGAPQS